MKRVLVILPLVLVSCVKYPEPYRPPIQRNPMEITGEPKIGHYVAMNQPDAPAYFVRDVFPKLNDNFWRWTLKSPTLQFRLPTTQRLNFQAVVTVAQETFKDTGPVTVDVFIEDHKLDTMRFQKPGEQVLLKPVPAEWLTTERPVIVRMEVDKLWTSPEDGTKYGVILTKLGFRQ